jgi:2-hydroxy-3-keto-5-methylthiopentenyl-1-phosphate phosphatase
LKDFIFVSDFDGTLTERDFYHIVIDTCLGDWGVERYTRWKQGEMRDVDFLAAVFQSIDRDESEIMKLISNIKLDAYAGEFIKQIRASGGDFVVLSAGASYYIEKLFASHGIQDVQVIANTGGYRNRGIKMTPDDQSPFYSELYGIDKYLVVQSLRTKYQKIYYAGDSTPDLKAALAADIAFAKGELIELLKQNRRDFVPVRSFAEIKTHLIRIGALI